MALQQLLLRGFLALVGFGVLALGGGYGWVLFAREPLNTPAAHWLPWPVACTTRGCITTWRWENYWQAAQQFATSTNSELPSQATVLTTLIRQHLAHHAQLRSPVRRADAIRYRQEILHGEDEEQIRAFTNLSLAEYDEQVLIPLLEQESLRQQRQAESAEDLYQQLAGERAVIVLPLEFQWNTETAQVR